MSILIKGMEMPDCCYECGLYQERKDTGYYDYAFCGASEEEFNDFYEKNVQRIDETEERLASCPLIEIPPHGALIDMDDFLSEWSELESYRTAMSLCEIIPAEEE